MTPIVYFKRGEEKWYYGVVSFDLSHDGGTIEYVNTYYDPQQNYDRVRRREVVHFIGPFDIITLVAR